MKKIIKKWGNSLVITFTPDECKLYGLKVDSQVTLLLMNEDEDGMMLKRIRDKAFENASISELDRLYKEDRSKKCR